MKHLLSILMLAVGLPGLCQTTLEEYRTDVAAYSRTLKLAEAKRTAADEESEEQASVFFETMKVSPDGELEIRFNTFGYVPTEKQVITLVVTDTGGTGHEFDFDVSDQFPDNPEQEIYVKTEDIVIDEPDVPESSGGGLAPEVDEWDDVIIDIPV